MRIQWKNVLKGFGLLFAVAVAYSVVLKILGLSGTVFSFLGLGLGILTMVAAMILWPQVEE